MQLGIYYLSLCCLSGHSLELLSLEPVLCRGDTLRPQYKAGTLSKRNRSPALTPPHRRRSLPPLFPGPGEQQPPLPQIPWGRLLLHRSSTTPRVLRAGGPGFSGLPSSPGVVLLAPWTEEHRILGVRKSTSPAGNAPAAATAAWKRLGELAAAKRRPANGFVSAFCSPACVSLPGAGMFERLQRRRSNAGREHRTPLTGLRKNRTINAKLQPVEHRKWY